MLSSESRAGIDVLNAKGQTSLHVAADQGHSKVVEQLVKAGARKEAASRAGLTPLMMAASNGHASAVETLVDFRVDLEARAMAHQHAGWTALHFAAAAGHTDVVGLLIGARADRLGCSLPPLPPHLLTHALSRFFLQLSCRNSLVVGPADTGVAHSLDRHPRDAGTACGCLWAP